MLDMACWIQFVVGGTESKLVGERHLGPTKTTSADIGDRGSVLGTDSLADEALGDGGIHTEGVRWASGDVCG